jgi:hypothetical protein
MKYKAIILTLAAASFFSIQAFAQASGDMTQAQRDRKDSVETATRQEAQVQTRKDENRMADAKLEKKETKAKAKDAHRIENEANDAANESKSALKAERKAQKSRKKADKQAKKAADAREKSNKN